MSRRTIIIGIFALVAGVWLGRQVDRAQPLGESADPTLAFSASPDDRVKSTLAALAEAEDELTGTEKARFKLWKKPIEALAAHSTAKQLEAEAKAIEQGVAAEEGKKGFVILGSLIAGAIVALVKMIIKLWIAKMVMAYLWAHIWYVVGISGVFVLVVWVIADLAATRAAYRALAKAKVAK